MEQGPSRAGWWSLGWAGNPSPFVEPEYSLPCSQEPTAVPCSEPDESSPELPTLDP